MPLLFGPTLSMAARRFYDVVGRHRRRLAALARSRLLMLAIALLLAAGVFAVVRAMDIEPVYILDMKGVVKPASADGFGIPYDDATFLSSLHGELVAGPLSEATPKISIHDSLEVRYKAQGHTLSKYHQFDSDREQLIAYLMLRVNGSLPIYNPAAVVPRDLQALISENEGNCGVAATRLLAVLESFSIPARAIIWYSPALQGHIFVDAYDPVEKKAYLLDPTFNLWSKFDDVEQGYLDVLGGMSTEERRRYLREGLVTFPFFIVAPVNMAENPGEFREEQYLKRKDALYSALTYELPIAMDNWKKSYPRAVPYNLVHAGSRFHNFSPDHALSTVSLLSLAGIHDFAPTQGVHSGSRGNSQK